MSTKQIRRIKAEQLKASGALELVAAVFQEFVAPDYGEEGRREFLSYIQADSIRPKLMADALQLWGYFEDSSLKGVLAAYLPCHISLLFVERHSQRKGIAKELLKEALAYYAARSHTREAQVNASPYAVEAYKRLGFTVCGAEQTINGMRFTPMCSIFR